MFERYYRELASFLALRIGDREQAADLVQESFARVLAMQHGGASVLNPRALLFRVAKNLLIDTYRAASASPIVGSRDALPTSESDPALSSPSDGPEAQVLGRQLAQAYSAALAELPEACRRAYELFAFEGLSQKAVAAQLGVSVSMVEKHVARALLACRECERWLDS
jgi:RNA polymerase sigma-70 factor (ECF subfamily)